MPILDFGQMDDDQPNHAWKRLTGADDSQDSNFATCQWCHQAIQVSKKLKIVVKHLEMCQPHQLDLKLLANTFLPQGFQQKVSPAHTSTSIPKFSVPKPPPLSESTMDNFRSDLAMHYFVSGTPFYHIEDAYLLKALKHIHPDITVPSRKELAGSLLHEAHERVTKEVKKVWNTTMCLTADGRTDTNGDLIVTYSICSGTNKEFFLEIKECTAADHTAFVLGNDVERIMAKYGVSNFVGCVTNITVANRWRTLEPKYPRHYFYGCACHCLHLITKRIFDSVNKDNEPSREELSQETCFEDMQKFVLEVKFVVSFFCNHAQARTALNRKLSEAKLPHLAEVGDISTSYGSIKVSMQTLLDSFEVIRCIVHSLEFAIWRQRQFTGSMGATTFDKIHDFFFKDERKNKDRLMFGVKLCIPLDTLITQFQGSASPLSEVYHEFDTLYDKYRDSFPELSTAQLKFLEDEIKYYWGLLNGSAHGMAYLLHPKYCGARMNAETTSKVCKLIREFPLPGTTAKLASDHPVALERQLQLGQYQIFVLENKDKEEPSAFYMDGVEEHPLVWWMTKGMKDWKALAPIAERVFSLRASTALAESSYSGMASVESTLRNSLCTESRHMLQAIRTNKRKLDQLSQLSAWG